MLLEWVRYSEGCAAPGESAAVIMFTAALAVLAT